MPTLYHLVTHVKRYGSKHKMLYFFSLTFMFWAIFDGIMSYIAPLVIVDSGLSKTLMGIIIGSSSISGAVFDFLMCRLFRSTFYRRIFIVMFILCALYPLLMMYANGSFWIYLIAMSVWGIYFDLKSFGSFDFVARHMMAREHSSSFGVSQVFSTLGYLLGPLLAGAMIGEMVGWQPFVLAWIFLFISFLFFLVLLYLVGTDKVKDRLVAKEHRRKINFLTEVTLWKKIGITLLPVLVLTLCLNIADSFFWTVGPLLAESFVGWHQFAGLFMAAYMLPSLLVGWFVGSLARRFGSKMTGFVSFLLSSMVISTLWFFSNPLAIMAVIFLSSCLGATSWPSISGAYADYISEAASLEKEIEGLEDLSANIGYIFGPIIAGFLADNFGNTAPFSIWGMVGVAVALCLIIFTPKKIKIKVKLK